MDRKERLVGNAKKVGGFFSVAIILVTLALAALGALTLVGEVPAFLESAGTIDVKDVVSITIREGDDLKLFEVESISAQRGIESGQIFLSVMGRLSASGQ